MSGQPIKIPLLPGTRAELIYKLNPTPDSHYEVGITSPLGQIKFANTLTVWEQFWLVKAINRMLRATTAAPSSPVDKNLDAFELAPEDLPADSPLELTEVTPDRLVINIPLCKSTFLRRVATWAILLGVAGLLSLMGWYRNPVVIFVEPIPFMLSLFCCGGILFSLIILYRTEVVVNSQVIIRRNGVGPIVSTKIVPLQNVQWVGVLRMTTNEEGNQVRVRSKVRRPTVPTFSCGIGSNPDHILLELGAGYDESVQLAALLRHRLGEIEAKWPTPCSK